MKKLLYAFVIVAFLYPTRAPATVITSIAQFLAQQYLGGDPITAMVGTVAGLLASFSEPEMGATVNVTQEEADALEAGSEKYIQAEMDGSATSQGFSTTAYDYVRQNLFEGGASISSDSEDGESDSSNSKMKFTTVKRSAWPYLNNRINDAMTVDGARKLVIDTFFVEDKEGVSQAKIDEVNKHRIEYLQAIGSEYSLLAQEVQKRLIADLESVNTTTFNGDGLIGAVTGVDQTWLAATRALMADIALQLQLLEVDAARFLQYQPVEILPVPAGLKTNNNSTGGRK
jgi:hypothetical protein